MNLEFESLDESQLAEAFVSCAVLASQLALQGDRKSAKRETSRAEAACLTSNIRGRDFNASFLRESLRLMNEVPREFLETDFHYRAFDLIDEALGFDYHVDDGMVSNDVERLYEGGGVGVQTSYSTLLTTLQALALVDGQKVIDLGSGFGRMGFAVGLLRPNVIFVGYEYVAHRVDQGNDLAERADLPNVSFVTQDLSNRDFKIPLANIYYMFDPFNAATYGFVLDQLIEIGRTQKITIATKGRANTWAAEALAKAGWQFESQALGSVAFFHSPKHT